MTTKVAPAEAEQAADPTMSLTDFCARLSETVKRPELIGAFEFAERHAKRIKATEAVFRARYEAFITTPA